MLTLLSLLLHTQGSATLAYITPEEMFLQQQGQYYDVPTGVALPINPRRAEWQAEADASSRQAAASAQAAALSSAQAAKNASSSSSSPLPIDGHQYQGDQADYWGPAMDWANTNLDPGTVRLLKRLETQSHLQSLQPMEPPPSYPSHEQPLASSGPGEILAASAAVLAMSGTIFWAWKKKMRGLSF